MKILICSNCARSRPIKAKGLCGSCYNAAWFSGTLPAYSDRDLPDAEYARVFRDRMLRQTVINSVTGCYEFQGRRTPKGYGITNYRSKQMFAHRASFRAFKGPIPAGKQIRHTCDCSSCWNPKHLIPGTQADNEQDKKDRGRFAYGQGSGRYNAKLTEADVAAILKKALAGITHTALAAEYGCARPGISRIVARKIWSHVS